MSIKREISFFWIFINPKRLIKPLFGAHLRCRRSEGNTSPNIVYQTKEHELRLVSFIPNSPASRMLFEVSEWPLHRVSNTVLAFVCFLLLADHLWFNPFYRVNILYILCVNSIVPDMQANYHLLINSKVSKCNYFQSLKYW